MAIRLLLFALGLACATGPAFAWVYPEHRDIAVLGVESLDPERKALFDRLWAEARIDHEKRLCEQGADTAQGVMPECIDWAAMSAIAGDHSCSSKQLLDTVSTSESDPRCRRRRGATQGRSVADLESVACRVPHGAAGA